MFTNGSFARRVRLRRLHHHDAARLFIVPLDQSVTAGPITGSRGLNVLVGQLATSNVDAVVLHKGSMRHIDSDWFTRTSLIVHLSASTMHAPDPNVKYLVASVEESLRMGADAVSVHVNLGSSEERQQISDMAAVSDACDRWNVPLLAMMYPRGTTINDPHDPELIAHAVTLAADLGADVVKTIYANSVDEMLDITRMSPVPVVVVGGPQADQEDAVLDYVRDALRGGAAGVAIGRNVFQAKDPGTMAARLAEIIHQGFVPAPDEIVQRLATVAD